MRKKAPIMLCNISYSLSLLFLFLQNHYVMQKEQDFSSCLSLGLGKPGNGRYLYLHCCVQLAQCQKQQRPPATTQAGMHGAIHCALISEKNVAADASCTTRDTPV